MIKGGCMIEKAGTSARVGDEPPRLLVHID